MDTYTADAVSMLCYLVDALPPAADAVYTDAELGNCRIEAPSTAVAEVLYAVARDREVRGVRLTGTPAETSDVLLSSGAVSLAPIDAAALEEYADVAETFSIHDGMIVASHRARGTDAIITSDGAIREFGLETVWG
ncbi:MAG: hypothetical protein U5K37_13440 [Natrialbaceae archaeon]|nr:hypothetical protein [Natrialbaceae archaeon]